MGAEAEAALKQDVGQATTQGFMALVRGALQETRHLHQGGCGMYRSHSPVTCDGPRHQCGGISMKNKKQPSAKATFLYKDIYCIPYSLQKIYQNNS